MPQATHCTEFARARAGDGLPAIEPGMPAPAGTGMSRRGFLLRSAGLALSVYGAGALAPAALEAGIEEAMAAAGDERVLVSVFLPGGVDSMTLLAPVGDPRYAELRPTLALAPDQGTAFAEDDRLRWHPAAAGLAALHGEGKVAVLPAVGYEGANQSHFTSRHFWEVGATDPGLRLGWLGRWLDAQGQTDNPLAGLTLASSLSPTLATARAPVAAISRPEDFSFWARGIGDPVREPMMEAFGRLGGLPGGAPALAGARAAVRDTNVVRAAIAPYRGSNGGPGWTSPVPYPGTRLAGRLSALAAMLDGGLPIRAVAVDGAGDFDTHSNQAATLPRSLQDSCDALLAFQRDLEARGLAGRVVTLVWSEFGRRPRQNGTGTDHGAAGCAFVVGTRVRGTMVGEFPGLERLDDHSNLRATSDFRGLYKGLLGQWLGADPAALLPGASRFTAPELIA